MLAANPAPLHVANITIEAPCGAPEGPRLPSFIVRPPAGDNLASVPPPMPPRPSGSSGGSITPPSSHPSSLQPSPIPSLRSSSPPPLPSRSSKASLTVPNDSLTDTQPPQPRYYDSAFTAQRGGSEPLLNTFSLFDQSAPPPIPLRPGQKMDFGDTSHTNGLPPPIPPRPPLVPYMTEPPSPQTASGKLPPPLPYRHRPSFSESIDTSILLPPRLPPRTQLNHVPVDSDFRSLPPPIHGSRQSAAVPPASSSSFLPPPIRTVARDKNAISRRSYPAGGSDNSSSESEEEEESSPQNLPTGAIPRKRLDELPDSTHASRRQPSFRSAFRVHAPVHVGVVAVAGNCVCVGHHSIKVYDLDSIDTPLHDKELKILLGDLKVKDPHRITSLAFRSAASKDDEGRYVWCGVKDGHLFEFDAWNGVIRDVRPNAHVGAVSHIMRYGQRMVTICDAGKAYVFSPVEEGADLNLSRSGASMRYMRISERQGFAKVFGHQLWTANGPGNNGVGGATATRGPAIRVYDLDSETNGPASSKTLIPSDPVGQVICGTILPSRPDKIYLGHEGGTITIWSRDGNDGSGTPTHSGTIKVGTSDVLALEGVRSLLWAGSRVGNIAAYDVETLPWTVTNVWKAHDEYPVFHIEADPYSIEKVRYFLLQYYQSFHNSVPKCARFTVFSVGRDERVRFWDGLLGVDYIGLRLAFNNVTFATKFTLMQNLTS